MENEVAAEGGIDMSSALNEMSESLFPEAVEVSDEDVTFESDTDTEAVEETKSDEPEEVKEEPKEEQKLEAPQSWKKEKRELFNDLSPDVQKYILEREDQMKAGIDTDREDAGMGRTIRDLFKPYMNQLQQSGIDAPTAVKALLNQHVRMMNASPDEKRAILNQYAKSYGITQEGDTQNPDLQKVMDELNGIKQQFAYQRQNARQAQIKETSDRVEKFASEHEDFDQLSDEIAKLIYAGYDLEDAYNNAKKLNSDTEAEAKKLAEKMLAEEKAKAKKEAEEAKKAKSVNIKSRDTRRTPTASLGTIEDTMQEVLRDINSRN